MTFIALRSSVSDLDPLRPLALLGGVRLARGLSVLPLGVHGLLDVLLLLVGLR